ncbi:MAG: two-component sensor histidine kinase [Deltaproteobacteria bacterium]|nr:two-component sensor histidine kinase [Deltaproteobacteria bacterium]
MSIIGSLKPKFLTNGDRDACTCGTRRLFNFRRMWNLAVFLTVVVALVPLISMTLIHYEMTQNAIESEVHNHTLLLVNNTWRAVSRFYDERKNELQLVAQEYTYADLINPVKLTEILKNIRKSQDALVDLGLINSSGIQTNYAGPYTLINKDYSNQESFKKAVEYGIYTSDLILGFRDIPHVVLLMKCAVPDGSFYVLRATLDIDPINKMLNEVEVRGSGDVFLINHKGVLQTSSRYHGDIFETISLPVPEHPNEIQVIERKNSDGETIVVGYGNIPDTPCILMTVQQKRELMDRWYKTRIELFWFLVISITLIMIVTLGISTYLVNKIYIADNERVRSLHKAEYSNRLASIGRLAAGVAHEINNPLAIINEKAGLIKDMFTYKDMYSEDKKLIGLIDSIIFSVERCGTITKRLLGFARHMEPSIQPINIRDVIEEVMGFLEKEAEYRSFTISLDIPDDIPEFENDRGKVQQIFLNLVNNSFAAMQDGGKLDIVVRRKDKDFITCAVTDTGCGISDGDIKRIFEPFFSTRLKKGGTGLGLSITCDIVQEIGAKINLQSVVGCGTSFSIDIPLKIDKERK